MTRRGRAARRQRWFATPGEAWAYIAALAFFYVCVLAAIAVERLGAHSLATFLAFLAVISTWVPGFVAQEQSGWDFGFRRSWTMLRYQVWLQLGLALPAAIRLVRLGRRG